MKMLTITEQSNGDYFTLYNNRLGSILRKFEGFEYATVKESIDDVSGEYGSVYITSKYGRRRMGIEGDLVSSNVFELRRNLLKALRQTGVMKLVKFTTYDDLELQCEAEVVRFTNPYTHKVHTFLIELIAPDWRFYSQTETVRDMGITTVLGGANIPFPLIPVSIPSGGGDDLENSQIIVNNGNEVTDPVFTISGPGTGFIVENLTQDRSFTYTGTLIEGDEVVIDVKARTVVKNGVDNVYSEIEGDFWSVLPGENELRFFVETGNDVEFTNLRIVYRDAYTGI